MLRKCLFDKTIATKYKNIIIVILIFVVLLTTGFLTYTTNANATREEKIKSSIDEILSSMNFENQNKKESLFLKGLGILMDKISDFLKSLESEKENEKENNENQKKDIDYIQFDSNWGAFFNKLIIIIAIIIIIALIFFIIRKLFRNYNQTKMIHYDIIEDILFELKEPDEIFDIAIKKYNEGRYRESLRYLYISIIVYLNRKDFVRIDKAKTNRQYVNELHNNEYEFLDLFKKFTMSFNIHWYGAITINRNEMEYWLGEYNRLTQEEGS